VYYEPSDHGCEVGVAERRRATERPADDPPENH